MLHALCTAWKPRVSRWIALSPLQSNPTYSSHVRLVSFLWCLNYSVEIRLISSVESEGVFTCSTWLGGYESERNVSVGILDRIFYSAVMFRITFYGFHKSRKNVTHSFNHLPLQLTPHVKEYKRTTSHKVATNEKEEKVIRTINLRSFIITMYLIPTKTKTFFSKNNRRKHCTERHHGGGRGEFKFVV